MMMLQQCLSVCLGVLAVLVLVALGLAAVGLAAADLSASVFWNPNST